ncbi:MAG: TonB-dependent receptor [Pseudomonadota bacterium]
MKKTTALTGLLCLSLLAELVFAEDSRLKEDVIEVGGDRAATRGVSSNTLSGQTLSRFGVGDLTAASRYVPGLLIIQSRTGITESVGIRGVAPNFRREAQQSVGLMIDGVPYQRSEVYKTSLLDINTIEVLKGPQATLFSENATTGAIRIRTNDPSETLESKFTLRHGRFDELVAGGVLSGPISSRLTARLAVQHDERDGFFSNSLGPDGVSTEEDNARLKLFYQFSDSTLVKLTGEYLHSEGKGTLGQINNVDGLGFFAFDPSHPSGGAPGFHPAVGLSAQEALRLFDPRIEFTLNDHQSSALETNFSDITMRNFRVNVDHDFSSRLHLNYRGGYSDLDHRIGVDQDRTPIPFFFDDERVDFSQLSHEFSIRGTNPRLEWLAGLSYSRSVHERVSDFSLTLPPGGPDSFEAFAAGFGNFAMIRDEWRRTKEIFSAFAELDFALSDKLNLVASGRWVKQDNEQDFYDAPFGGAVLNPSGNTVPPGFTPETFAVLVFGTNGGCYSDRRFAFYEQIGLGAPCQDRLSFADRTFSPHVSLRWQITDSIKTYLSWSQSYKSGTYQFDRMIEPERAEGIELGVKFDSFGSRLRGSVALFQTEFKDRQVDARVSQQTLLTNDAELSIEGLEMTLLWDISQSWMVDFGLTVSNSSFDRFSNAGCTSDQLALLPPSQRGACVQDLDGRRSYRSPDHEVTISLSYQRPFETMPWTLKIGAHLNFMDNYSGNSNGTLDPHNEQEAFEQIDAHLSLSSNDGIWKVNTFVRNVTDDIIRGGSSPVFFMPGAFFSEAGPGRTYAVQLTWSPR